MSTGETDSTETTGRTARTGPAAPPATTGPAAPPATTGARIVVSPAGWCVAATAAVGLVTGVLFGWTELFVAGVICALVALVSGLFLLGGTPVQIGLEPPPSEVTVGAEAVALITVSNPSRLRVRPGVLEVDIDGSRVPLVVGALEGHATVRSPQRVPTGRRGVVTLGPVTAITGDPLGLVRREAARSGTIDVVVRPVTVALGSVAPGLLRDLEGLPSSVLTDSDLSFHALRPYTRGDDLRHIHWRSSAKSGTFLVRQFEETRRSHVLVLLATAPHDHADDEEFELAVSTAASLGVRALAEETRVSVFAPRATAGGRERLGRLRGHARSALLDDLGRVTRAEGAPGLERVAGEIAREAADASVVFVCAGSTASAAQLRAVSAMLPSGAEVVAVVARPASPGRAARMGRLRILNLGRLAELPRMLVRAVGL
ncbi:DUF58 domain-containing protein [Herbiconiux moechotypicola]|uniref:DUF58 domain-containing protein n=1 Tax=Herbiconiux moechotypicola TaxID=637393 RepID=A0ABN3D8V0_9MICO|nr:DUF58 domain-containing protein [Herbiconiux moechotypicola]MCS5728318.1 DUF58 domain-containing protein [Herbiconiux moechotypicola]